MWPRLKLMIAIVVTCTCLALLQVDNANAEENGPVPESVDLIAFPAAGENPPSLQGEVCIPLRPNAETTVPGVVICHAHPLYGGTMDNPMVIRMRDQLLEMGIATLRFNFRGVGESEGQFGGGVAEVDDVLGALAALRARPEVKADRCGLAGYSFGSSMALEASARDQVMACGLVAFPTEIAEDGMGDFNYLQGLTVPILFVTGTGDVYSHIEALTGLVTRYQLKADVIPIEGADHFFTDAGWREVTARAIGDFMAAKLVGEL
ncbi:MAG TPA: alpha/beta family hydrolase [Armatimonadota bacterium]|nr:alpha/beta family hydrolase [Armatimonadota bacterium]